MEFELESLNYRKAISFLLMLPKAINMGNYQIRTKLTNIN